jgi:hypothetical protein
MRQTSQNGQKRIPWAQFGHTDKVGADLPDTRDPLALLRLAILAH